MLGGAPLVQTDENKAVLHINTHIRLGTTGSELNEEPEKCQRGIFWLQWPHAMLIEQAEPSKRSGSG